MAKLTELTTHNPGSDTALLGSFEPNSVTSYEQIAYANGWTYFDAGSDGWNAMAKVDYDLAKDVNDQFLINQINKRKDFVLTKSPEEAQKAFIESGGKRFVSYNAELTMLDDNGYKI
ncbi:TPA: hypothetical protein TVK09_001938, partial [Streptococcus equi subsp. zooepidemicus]|nr:hypothetical protein [Streptococcus equi subsp. zooepidemicus]